MESCLSGKRSLKVRQAWNHEGKLSYLVTENDVRPEGGEDAC